MKCGLDTRPIYHKMDDAIRGHVFCSFLAILLRGELERRLEKRGLTWNGTRFCVALRHLKKWRPKFQEKE